MAKPRKLPDQVQPLGKHHTKSGKLEYAFLVPCPWCGVSRVVKRRQHAIALNGKRCKRCSNKNNNPIGLVRGVRLSFFNRYESSALQRNKEWDITAEDAAIIFELQRGRCVLTGLLLDAGASGCALNDITASLDRIDNSVGYVVGNIQWVHKDINMLRGSFTIDRFIELCQLVVDHKKSA